MEDNKTIFNYIGQVFTTFGIMILIFVALAAVVGEKVEGFGSLFELGEKGLALGTILQLLALSVIITVCQAILFTDKLIKSLSIVARNVAFYVAITVVIAAFVVIFNWFPINDFLAWIGFIISFAICSAIGVFISRMKEKAEDRKMNKALEKYNNR